MKNLKIMMTLTLMVLHSSSWAFRMHNLNHTATACIQKNTPSDPEKVFPFLGWNQQSFQHWQQQNLTFYYTQAVNSPHTLNSVSPFINMGMNRWNNVTVQKYQLSLSNQTITTQTNPVGINDGINSIYIDPFGTIPVGQQAYSPAHTTRTINTTTGQILDADIHLRFFSDTISEPGLGGFPINFASVFAHDFGHALGINDTQLNHGQDIMKFPLVNSTSPTVDDEQAIRCSQFKYHHDAFWPAFLSNLGSHTISDSWVIEPDDLYFAGDFRGRGLDDLLMINQSGDIELVELNRNNHLWSWDTLYSAQFSASYLSKIYNAHLLVGDFNGDQVDEFLVIDKATGASDLHQFNGNSWVPLHNTHGPSLANWPVSSTPAVYLPGDYNGDGNSEILIIGNNGQSQLIAYDASSGWTTKWSASNNLIAWWVTSSNDSYGVGDFNRDGRDELIAINPNGWTHTMAYDGNDWQNIAGNGGNNSLDWWPIDNNNHPDAILVGAFCRKDISRNEATRARPPKLHDGLIVVNVSQDAAAMMHLENLSSPWPFWKVNKSDTNDKLWTIDHQDIRLVGNFYNSVCDEILNINPNGLWQLNNNL